MGDLVYNYLARMAQGYFVPHSYNPLDHPLAIGDTSGLGMGYVSEQPTSDFSMPSPSYVTKPPSPLCSSKLPSQELPGLPLFHPLTATFRDINPGASAVSITSTRIEVPPSQAILREHPGKVVLQRMLERLSRALGM